MAVMFASRSLVVVGVVKSGTRYLPILASESVQGYDHLSNTNTKDPNHEGKTPFGPESTALMVSKPSSRQVVSAFREACTSAHRVLPQPRRSSVTRRTNIGAISDRVRLSRIRFTRHDITEADIMLNLSQSNVQGRSREKKNLQEIVAKTIQASIG